MPPTNDYKIKHGRQPSGQITAGIIGYDQFDFSPDSTTIKVLSQPRAVTVTFDNGIFFHDVWVYNHSTLNFDGGTVLNVGNQKGKVVLDDSTLNVNEKSLYDVSHGTSIFAIDANGQSIVNMFSGTSVYQNVNIRDTSHLEADEVVFGIGPNSEGFGLHDGASGTVIYSTFDNVSADGEAILEVRSSSIGGNVQTNGSASVALVRTDVTGGIWAYGSSHITVAGEDETTKSPVASVLVDQSATISLTNVSTQGGATALDGHLNLANVSADGSIEARGSSVVVGSGLSAGSVAVHDNAVVMLNSGTNIGMLEVNDSANLAVTDITADSIRTYGGRLSFVHDQITGSVFVYGGEATLTDVESVAGSIYVGQTAKLVLKGNTNVFLNVLAGGDAFLTGGSVQNASASFEGFVALTDVLVRGGANATSGGRIQMNSGYVTQDLAAFAGGEVNLSGGSVAQNLVAAGSGIVNMFGGHVVGRAFVDQFSTFNFFGGTIDGEIFPLPPPTDDGGEEGSAGLLIASELLDAGSPPAASTPCRQDRRLEWQHRQHLWHRAHHAARGSQLRRSGYWHRLQRLFARRHARRRLAARRPVDVPPE